PLRSRRESGRRSIGRPICRETPDAAMPRMLSSRSANVDRAAYIICIIMVLYPYADMERRDRYGKIYQEMDEGSGAGSGIYDVPCLSPVGTCGYRGGKPGTR